MSDIEIDSEQSDESLEDRPNRFKSSSHKWRNYTAEERGEYASLVNARNEDLSIHLYNAHALRQRAIEYEKDPANAKVNREYPEIPKDHRTFKPPSYWTAWPLPPGDVPRAEESKSNRDGSDSYTVKKRKTQHPSSELEEVLCAVILKCAREKFEARDCQNDIQGNSQMNIFETSINQEIDSFENGVVSNKYTSPSSSSTNLRPISSLDDEKSHKLLRPSIRHIFTKLDKLLMALHESRRTCFRYPHKKVRNEDGTPTLSERRVPGRPRISAPELDNLKNSLGFEWRNESAPRSNRRIYPRLDGETEPEYLVRLARLKKETIPSFAIRQEPASSSKILKSKSNLGLRDWSDVLGSAAVTGISENAISRAAQRCADLFGEGMEFRHFVETSFKKHADFTIRYTPSPIPSLSSSDSESISTESSLNSSDHEFAAQASPKSIPRDTN